VKEVQISLEISAHAETNLNSKPFQERDEERKYAFGRKK